MLNRYDAGETLNGYDPDYKEKVKLAVEAIERELSKRKQFSADDVNRHVEFDCGRHLKLLVRAHFLEVVPGGKQYTRLAAWPPPADFFGGTPIGVAYYLQRWFRYRLQDWITRRMRELETKEGVYSLEQWQRFHRDHAAEGSIKAGHALRFPAADADFTDCHDSILPGSVLRTSSGRRSTWWSFIVLAILKPEAEMVAWSIGQVLPDAEVEFRGRHRSMT